ncbi:protein preY, mitochondrial-like [Periophthalmus magnuspinnatus]|uniref:Protein preY, mitochondrial n=1 Tax=Periophthalmus magnuspinnatus TaxID=409849 RepID=A0A3B4B8X8_9GOBI|nr:protein preY, mitochondrial-like [Periophthalmus magnuspinnatus]
MFYHVLRRLSTGTVVISRCVGQTLRVPAISPAVVPVRSFTDPVQDTVQPPFDASLLEVLVCPLSKKPLRYEAETNELINDELGIAYPVVDGIPNMIPQDARLIQKTPETPTQE